MKAIKTVIMVAVLFSASIFYAKAAVGISFAVRGSNTVFKMLPPKTRVQTDTGGKKIEEFKKEWNKKMKALDNKISKEEKKVKSAGARNKVKLNNQIDDLKSEKEYLQQKIDNAQYSSDKQWNEFKGSVKQGYKTLKRKTDSLFRH